MYSKNPFRKEKRIHLDYASTTPVHKEVFDTMKPFFNETWANASAIYKEGVAMREVVENERGDLAKLLHVRPSDITYTSGGTESNNLAIIGLVLNLLKNGISFSEMHIISTEIEHPSVIEALKHVETMGVHIEYAGVDQDGRIDIRDLESKLTIKTRLVTCAYVNSEIGTIQDIKKISRTVKAWNEKNNVKTVVHIDACQAPLWLPCALDTLGVDMVSLDAGKCYGPKGVGVLVKRHWIALNSIMFGGGQEVGLRPGTENVALVVGCTRALIRAQKNWEERSMRVQKIRDYCIEKIKKELPHAILNGSNEHRVANNINISLPGIDGEYAVITLDTNGIAASTRSACGAGKGQGSHVVRIISKDESRALSTIRITLGEESKIKDVDVTIDVLLKHLQLMK